MRTALAALVTVAALAACAPASAAEPSDEQVQQLAVQVARQHLPAGEYCPDPAQRRVVLHADDVLDAQATEGGTVIGWADVVNCTVYVASDLPADLLCVTIVHELGHLAYGLGHTRSGLMAADAHDYAPCSRALEGWARESAMPDAKRTIRRRLPGHGRGWSLTCRTLDRHAHRCVARRGSHRAAYTVAIYGASWDVSRD